MMLCKIVIKQILTVKRIEFVVDFDSEENRVCCNDLMMLCKIVIKQILTVKRIEFVVDLDSEENRVCCRS